MNIFFLPDVGSGEASLNTEESHHAVKVLRLKQNDVLRAVDGIGNWYEAVIIHPDPKKCRLKILSVAREAGKSPYHLHLAVAPTKNSERTDWFLEKATEIGISEYTPLLTCRCERQRVNRNRLLHVAIAAMKQSHKAYLPQIHDPLSFELFVSRTYSGQKYIAHCQPGEKPHLKSLLVPAKQVLVLIGPEGDFTPEEVEQARKNGFLEISLGPSLMRTETAALTACLTVYLGNY